MKCLISHSTPAFSITQFNKFFDVVKFDPNNLDYNFTTTDHFVILDSTDNIDPWQDRGFKVVVLHVWDQLLDNTERVCIKNNCLHLRPKNWIWMHFSWAWKIQNYDYIRPSTSPDHFFLLLMNLQRDHRDQLFEITKPYHDISLYSYVERGYYIKDDVPATGTPFQVGTSDQSFYNPAWYAQTSFSMVSESSVTEKRFISEKIFKPVAFQHAFVVHGTPGSLQYLHELGFETFDHVIDESYDKVSDYALRLQLIQSVLKNLYQEYSTGKSLFADTVSQQKIQHNYHNFYNVDKLDQMWVTEIVNPVREFLNA
jgi:hypothetical protein